MRLFFIMLDTMSKLFVCSNLDACASINIRRIYDRMYAKPRVYGIRAIVIYNVYKGFKGVMSPYAIVVMVPIEKYMV